MDQLAPEGDAASEGASVDTTTAAPDTVVENQPAETTADDMYPDDQPQPDGEEGEQTTEEQDPEPEEPAIEAPHSWKAEDKEKWGALPREAQEIIARRETEVARLITQKSTEAATAKETVVEQAKTEIAQFREAQAQRYMEIAAQFMPQPPDERLLWSQDPNDHLAYQQQEVLFRRAAAQQQQLQQAAQHEQTLAQQIRDEQSRAAKAADDNRLLEAWPEWFTGDEASAKLQADLKSIAIEVGYPEELWEERNASDVLALRKVAQWKADAQRWQSYDRNRRNQNGQFKPTRQLPPVTRPGTSTGRPAQTDDPVKLLYPND